MDTLEDRVRDRAHQLWDQDGRPDGRHVEYWLAAEKELKAADDNEGEGNRTAARRYNSDTKKFVASGKVAPKAREAAAALDDPKERQALQAAEAVGKSHSHGEDPVASGSAGPQKKRK